MATLAALKADDSIYLQLVEGEVIRTKYVSHGDDTLVTKRSTSRENAPVTHELSSVVHVQPAKVSPLRTLGAAGLGVMGFVTLTIILWAADGFGY